MLQFGNRQFAIRHEIDFARSIASLLHLQQFREAFRLAFDLLYPFALMWRGMMPTEYLMGRWVFLRKFTNDSSTMVKTE
jgi:hypothetical protein